MLINNINIIKIGNSFKLKNGITIYIDPYGIHGFNDDKADIILISHNQVDTCSRVDVDRLRKDDTVIIAPGNCVDKLGTVNIVSAGDELEFFGIKIKTVHAYNLGVNKRYHIKNFGVGYKLLLHDQVVYYAGHTDFIPELSEIGVVDIAILPVGNPEVMNVEDAVDAANTINAKIVIPFYYGNDEGEQMREQVVNSKVIIL